MNYLSALFDRKPDDSLRLRRYSSHGAPGRARFSLFGASFLAVLMVGMMVGMMAATLPAAAGDVEAEPPAGIEQQTESRYVASKGEHDMKLFVGTQLMQIKQEENPSGFIPLLWGLENLGHRGLTIDRSLIRLFHQDGAEIPLAGLEAFRRQYDRQRFDRQALNVTNFGGELDRTARLVQTNFFPMTGETAIERIQVPRWGKVIDLLYFQGLVDPGERLRLEVGFLEETEGISVEFSIP